jgi:hypothetical protein
MSNFGLTFYSRCMYAFTCPVDASPGEDSAWYVVRSTYLTWSEALGIRRFWETVNPKSENLLFRFKFQGCGVHAIP